jgi:hypothetical protein
MTVGQAVSNLLHSVSFTTMKFDAVPTAAVRELCGSAADDPQGVRRASDHAPEH